MVLAQHNRSSSVGWLALGLVTALLASCSQSLSGGVKTGPDGTRRSVEVVHEPCDVNASSAQRTDVNGDGKPELVAVMKGGALFCQAMDLNLDGTIDRYAYYEAGGQIRRTESDYDRDGRTDEIALYRGGVVVEKHREMNLDGKLDTWLFFENGAPVRQERDTDGDGRIDEWWQFGSGKDATGAPCATVARDIDGDGQPEPSSQIDTCQQDSGGLVPGAMPNYNTAPPASASGAPAAPTAPATSATGAPSAAPAAAPTTSAAPAATSP